jgi:DNA repair photolyase
VKMKTILCKSVLTKSNLPEVDYCINPYVGCLHACVYCYARFMKRFTSHKEPWGHFLDIKLNAPAVLAHELVKKPKRGTVLIGSVTDAYQPIERRYRLTREILEVLLQYDFPISILTKSNLVVRDLDLLQQFRSCEVGLTITTMDQKVASNFESYSSTPNQRVRALETLHRNGIITYAFIGPILPELTNLEDIFALLQGKVDYVMAESLNMQCGNRQFVEAVLSNRYPQLLPLYQKGFSSKYWAEIKATVKKLTAKHRIPLRGFFSH